jgi:hypothetical protein
MKSVFKRSILFSALLLGLTFNSRAQSIKLLASDALNGAATGAALGGATMALQDSDDWAPVRVGVGLGILYGIGTGIYDNSMISGGEQLYISGTFNDGKNSTILVLLDTMYGAAGGAAVGGAISLIANDPVLEGFQYGAGAGAWIGFGFGLIDAFILAETPNNSRAAVVPTNNNHAKGIVQINSSKENISWGFLNPSVLSRKKVNTQSISVDHTMGVEVLNMNVSF